MSATNCKVSILGATLAVLVVSCCYSATTAATSTTTTPTTTTTTTAKPYTCDTSTGTIANIKNEISEAFSITREIDLVFIFDNTSPASYQSLYGHFSKLVSDFVIFGGNIPNGKLMVTSGNTRLTVIPVGRKGKEPAFMTDLVCSLDKYVSEEASPVSIGTGPQGGDTVSAATDAYQLLKNSGRKKRHIVIIFTDREHPLEKTVAVQSVLQLANAEVFVVGFGEAQDMGPRSQEAEESLKNLTTADHHYACVAAWRSALTVQMQSDRDDTDEPLLLRLLDEPAQSQCEKCNTTQQCACHVTTQTYQCLCRVDFQLTSTGCKECPPGTCKPDIGNGNCTTECVISAPVEYQVDATLFWIIFGIAAAVFLVLGLLFTVVYLVVNLKHVKKKEKDVTPAKRPIPPSRGIANRAFVVEDEEGKRVPMREFVPNAGDEYQEPLDTGGRPLPPPPSPLRKDSGNPDTSIYQNNMLVGVYQNTQPPKRGPEHRSLAALRGSGIRNSLTMAVMAVQPQAKMYEFGMPGWQSDLEKVVDESSVEAVAVYHIDGQHWARTKGIRLRTSTLDELEKIMRAQGSGGSKSLLNSSDNSMWEFSIGDSKYRIDRNVITENELRMTGPIKNDDMYKPHPTVLCACKAGQYIVVAKAKTEDSDECQRKARELQRHLTGMQETPT